MRTWSLGRLFGVRRDDTPLASHQRVGCMAVAMASMLLLVVVAGLSLAAHPGASKVLAALLLPAIISQGAVYLVVRFLRHPAFTPLAVGVWLLWMVTGALIGYFAPAPGANCLLVSTFFLYPIAAMPRYGLALAVLVLAAATAIAGQERSASYGLYSRASTPTNTNQTAYFIRALLVAVVAPWGAILALQYVLRSARATQESCDAIIAATTQFAERIAAYDTRGGLAVAEDHAEALPPEFLSLFQDIVSNLDQYRPFLPAALQPTSRDDYGSSMSVSHVSNLSTSRCNPLINPELVLQLTDQELIAESESLSSSVSSVSDAILLAPRVSYAVVALLHVELPQAETPGAQALAFAAAVSLLSRVCRDHGAHIRTIVGQVVEVTWICASSRIPHRTVASFCIALRGVFSLSRERASTQTPFAQCAAPCQVSGAISTGSVILGVSGDQETKLFYCLGPLDRLGISVQLNAMLEGARLHNALVVSPELAEMLTGSHYLRAIDAIAVTQDTGKEGRHREVAVKIYEVVAPVDNTTATVTSLEWMYALQQGPSAAFGLCDVMNRAMEKYTIGHYEEASAVLDVLGYQQRLDGRLMQLEANVAAFLKAHGPSAKYARRFKFGYE